MKAAGAALGRHVILCQDCLDALIAHDDAAPKCGDNTCARVAYCATGAKLRDRSREA